MSVVSLKYYGIIAICDFDYSKFRDENGHHVRCEISSDKYNIQDLYNILSTVIDYLDTTLKGVRSEISISKREIIELKIYDKILSKGLSFYDIIDKICLITGYELWKTLKI